MDKFPHKIFDIITFNFDNPKLFDKEILRKCVNLSCKSFFDNKNIFVDKCDLNKPKKKLVKLFSNIEFITINYSRSVFEEHLNVNIHGLFIHNCTD